VKADAYGHAKKVDIGPGARGRDPQAYGDAIMGSDLTYDRRRASPTPSTRVVAITVANIEVDLLRDGVIWPHRWRTNGCYAHAAASRFIYGRTQSGFPSLQHGALSP